MAEWIKTYFKEIEKNVEALPQDMRAHIYKTCGQSCAKQGVLKAYEKLFESCEKDMDELYNRMHELGGVKGKVIVSQKVYEMTFPKCLCGLYEEGYLSSPGHCECSRQSILYVLEHLMPSRRFEVGMKQSVLGGASECVFMIYVIE